MPTEEEHLISKILGTTIGLEPPKLEWKFIELWTHNFSTKLGEGAFGEVFEGIVPLPIGRVAIKKISTPLHSTQDPKEEQKSRDIAASFRREVNFLSRFRHENIIRLFGYADEGIVKGQIRVCLVYELARNHSFDRVMISNFPL